MSKDFTDEFFEDEDGVATPDEGTAPGLGLKAEPDPVEPEDAPEPQPATAEADGDDDAPGETDDGEESPVTRGQLAALMSEREKRQAIEREKDELARKLAEFESEREKREREQQQQQAQKPLPDPFDDPNGFREHIQEQYRRQLTELKVNNSRIMAETAHGADTVKEAWEAFDAACKSDPSVSAYSHTLVDDPHPVDKVIQWHKRQKLLSEIGDDPEAYRQRLIAEALEKQQAEVAPADPAKPKASPPPSLAKGGTGGASEQPVSEEEFFASVFTR